MGEAVPSPSPSINIVDDTYRLQSAVGSLFAGLSRAGLQTPTSTEYVLKLLADFEAVKDVPRRNKGGITSRLFQAMGSGRSAPVDAVDVVYEELAALSRVVASLNATDSDIKLALDFVAGTEARTRGIALSECGGTWEENGHRFARATPTPAGIARLLPIFAQFE